MRKTVAVLFLSLVAMLGVWVPSVSAAYVSNAKVVIIVGAVHGQTDSYRQRGEAAYQEAIKYTPNVKKVFSPNATWSAVVSATRDANIVIYMGHGNGWPSPYTYDSKYTTKDGFGLNATAGNGDHNVKYYGEPSVATLDLAPNAVILLHHLCYASGNSEPGDPEPSTSTAKLRVDNYAAGFLRSPARAVIADGHSGPAYYLRALMTTNQTVLDMWRNAPNYHSHEFGFPGTRSAGYRAYMDPTYTSKSFYRSLVVKPGLTTREVTGVVGDTGLDPASFAVPGRASVGSLGAELLADSAGTVAATLPAETRLKLVSRPTWKTADNVSVLQVAGLDDPSIAGYVRTTQLVPRDSLAPVAVGVDASSSALSPNGDDAYDTTTLSARFSETVDWTLRVTKSDGTEVAATSGTAKEPAVLWDGLVDGDAVADGTYTYTFKGQDAWLNAPSPVSKSGTVKVDTTPPTLSLPAAADTVPWFSPNGDGVSDTFALKASTSESGKVQVGVRTQDGDLVRTFSSSVSSGAFSIGWDGRDNDGDILPDGTYDVRLVPVDAVGNSGTSGTITVKQISLLGSVASSKSIFYPQDRDSLASGTTLSFWLRRTATVTWEIRNATGDVVATLIDGEERPGGTHSVVFNGKRADGTMLPTGKYTARVHAVDGDISVSQSATFEMNAFAVRSSDYTPKRGQRITISATTAEALSGSVTVSIFQPGKTAWTVKMTKVSSTRYTATITLKTGGSAGTLKLSVQATDAHGKLNKTYLKLPLS